MTSSKLAAFLSLIAALAACGLQSAEFDRELSLVNDLGNLTSPPKYYIDSGYSDTESLKSIYFDALDYKGKPTRVFAWLGLPEGRNGKVPGMVLVHGGGGSAFKEWVQKWNDAGFAAISIAVEGQTDAMDPDFKDQHNPRGWVRHEWAGPRRVGIYGDMDEPIQEQWMYHAVADTVLANSLLRSLPEVNAEQVGVMGISWGGVITSTVMGIDNRFAFAIPTYGCGHLFDADNQYGRVLGDSDLYKQVWDPMVRMHQAIMPALWFSWPEDQHFPMDCLAECYRAMPGDVMVALKPGMRHGHAAAWNPPDSYAFAKSVLKDGEPWCLQKQAQLENGQVSVVFDSKRELESAVLLYTTDNGFTGDRKWEQKPASITKDKNSYIVNAHLPVGAIAWLVNVHSKKLTASSQFYEIE